MLEQAYIRECRKKYSIIICGVILIIILGFVFTTLGMSVPLNQPFAAVYHYVNGDLNSAPDAAMNKIILLLRMPRIILSMLAGIGLAVAGAVMQSITRNYLVSPFTLGISSAAAFGASVCIVFGSGIFFHSNLGIIGSAFLASCICGLVVYGIASRMGLQPSSLVLVGIALNYLFSAMTATIEFFAQEHKLEAVVQWTFGSFNRASWDNVLLSAIVVMICIICLYGYSLKLNAMAVNDDETVRSLGINPDYLRTVGGLLSIFLTATIISFTGVIGFVGLIAPHMARFIIGNDHRFYLPLSAVLGALLLLVSDTLGKFILYPVNVPVGIVVSFVGVPIFIHLILNARKGGL